MLVERAYPVGQCGVCRKSLRPENNHEPCWQRYFEDLLFSLQQEWRKGPSRRILIYDNYICHAVSSGRFRPLMVQEEGGVSKDDPFAFEDLLFQIQKLLRMGLILLAESSLKFEVMHGQFRSMEQCLREKDDPIERSDGCPCKLVRPLRSENPRPKRLRRISHLQLVRR